MTVWHEVPVPRPVGSQPSACEVPVATAEEVERGLRRMAGGVAVVTARGPAGPVGCTVTSSAVLSVRPAVLSFGVDSRSPVWPTLSLAKYVAVHVLGADQVALAERFAVGVPARDPEPAGRSAVGHRGCPPDPFASGLPWSVGPRRLPLLDGVLAWFAGLVELRLPVDDQFVVLLRVRHTGLAGSGEALVRLDDRWARTMAAPRRRPLAGCLLSWCTGTRRSEPGIRYLG